MSGARRRSRPARGASAFQIMTDGPRANRGWLFRPDPARNHL